MLLKDGQGHPEAMGWLEDNEVEEAVNLAEEPGNG